MSHIVRLVSPFRDKKNATTRDGKVTKRDWIDVTDSALFVNAYSAHFPRPKCKLNWLDGIGCSLHLAVRPQWRGTDTRTIVRVALFRSSVGSARVYFARSANSGTVSTNPSHDRQAPPMCSIDRSVDQLVTGKSRTDERSESLTLAFSVRQSRESVLQYAKDQCTCFWKEWEIYFLEKIRKACCSADT